jgi:hypothetical protein
MLTAKKLLYSFLYQKPTGQSLIETINEIEFHLAQERNYQHWPADYIWLLVNQNYLTDLAEYEVWG